MKFMIKLWLTVAVLAAVAVGALWVWGKHSSGTQPDISPTQITDIREMVKLCTMELEDEVAMKDSIHGKWIFSKARLQGNISFDLEKMKWEQRGDTIFVELPPEEVRVRESTAPNSYEVIDTWDDSLLGLGKITAAEENALKNRLTSHYRRDIYRKGYVARARRSALGTLRNLTRHLPGTVIVTDPQMVEQQPSE